MAPWRRLVAVTLHGGERIRRGPDGLHIPKRSLMQPLAALLGSGRNKIPAGPLADEVRHFGRSFETSAAQCRQNQIGLNRAGPDPATRAKPGISPAYRAGGSSRFQDVASYQYVAVRNVRDLQSREASPRGIFYERGPFGILLETRVLS